MTKYMNPTPPTSDAPLWLKDAYKDYLKLKKTTKDPVFLKNAYDRYIALRDKDLLDTIMLKKVLTNFLVSWYD